jgi:hypothetical protein
LNSFVILRALRVDAPICAVRRGSQASPAK